MQAKFFLKVESDAYTRRKDAVVNMNLFICRRYSVGNLVGGVGRRLK